MCYRVNKAAGVFIFGRTGDKQDTNWYLKRRPDLSDLTITVIKKNFCDIYIYAVTLGTPITIETSITLRFPHHS